MCQSEKNSARYPKGKQISTWSKFSMKLQFPRQIFFEKYFKFMEIRQVGAELFHVDGQTDVTKLTVAFRNFANAPKN